MSDEAEGAETGLALAGSVLARAAIANRETGEIRGYAYRVLAGTEVFEVTSWAAKPWRIGERVACAVTVRAYARKGGTVSWSLTVLEAAKETKAAPATVG